MCLAFHLLQEFEAMLVFNHVHVRSEITWAVWAHFLSNPIQFIKVSSDMGYLV